MTRFSWKNCISSFWPQIVIEFMCYICNMGNVSFCDSQSQLYLQWDALLVLHVHLRSINGSLLLLFNFQISVLCPDVGSNVHWLTATPDPSVSIFKPFRFGPQGQGRTSVLTQSSLPFPHQAKVCLGKQVSY
jgi:hypothetical protein